MLLFIFKAFFRVSLQKNQILITFAVLRRTVPECRDPSPRLRAYHTAPKKHRSGGKLLATLWPNGPGWELNLDLPLPRAMFLIINRPVLFHLFAICFRQEQRIRNVYFKSILRQDITYHEEVSAGELTSRLSQ